VTIRISYKANNASMAKLLMSGQTQDLADQGARRGAATARSLASGLGLPEEYVASVEATGGPPSVLGGNPRRTARVVARYPWLEFGSGRRRERPQGGRSPAYRVLGRTGPLIGNPPRGGGPW
jgi:hypothetical protein